MSANDNQGPENESYDPEAAKILGLNYKLAIIETGIDSLQSKLKMLHSTLKEIVEFSKKLRAGNGET